MSGKDIQPNGAQPIWPMAPQPYGTLAVPQWNAPSQSIIPEINLATLWRILYEWRWLILGSIAVCLAAAIVVSLLTTPLYRATSTLELNPPSIEIMDNNKSQQFMSNDRQFLATQYGLLRSRALAERVAQELNLAGDREFLSSDADRATRQKIAAGILAGNFSVNPVEDSRLVYISYSSPSPGLAAKITNGFADSFINTNLERRYDASSSARNFLQSQIGKVKAELERSEKQLIG